MKPITMSDLIGSLRQAAASPEQHAYAQLRYFSIPQDDSVLVNCGSACCVAGDLILQAHADESEDVIANIIHNWDSYGSPADWVTRKLGLTDTEATLAFDANTHYQVHALLADLLEEGLRLPDVCSVGISCESNYVAFDCAFFGFYQKSMDLEELLGWMREIAVPNSELKRNK